MRLAERRPVESLRGSTGEEALEQGDILYFPPGLFSLPRPQDLEFFAADLPKHLRFKNISYHPNGDYLSGARGSGALRARTAEILSGHHAAVVRFFGAVVPGYADGWRSGTDR